MFTQAGWTLFNTCSLSIKFNRVYNDLGLPLAFAFTEGIINHTPTLEQYINETWALFIEGLDVEDTGFEDIADLLDED